MDSENLDYELSDLSQIQKKSTLMPNTQEQWNLGFPVQKQIIHTT